MSKRNEPIDYARPDRAAYDPIEREPPQWWLLIVILVAEQATGTVH